MLLNALWAGFCTRVTAPPAYCDQLARLTGLPLIFLQNRAHPAMRGNASHEESELGLDLSLGDVLHHELGIEVPRDAVILFISQTAKAGAAEALTLLAEALEAGIRRSSAPLPISLMVWTYLSLSAEMVGEDGSLVALRDAALERICDYPARRAMLNFETYLALLEPGFTQPRPESALARKLEGCADMSDWLDRIQTAFEHSNQRDLARS